MSIFYISAAAALLAGGAMIALNWAAIKAQGTRFISWVILKISGWVGK